MSTPNINLTSLDFADIKNNLKTYLRSQSIFKDYDFEGSNMSVILDVLSYNTYMNNFYLNMVGSEMFLDTAQQRDSAVLKAKELNYLPRSFRSAYANVNLKIVSNNVNKAILTIPKGTSFTGKYGSNNYTFVTDENIVVTVGANNTFYANNILLYEGAYYSDTFAVNYSQEPQKFVISSPRVDTTSVSVVSIENSGANVIPYQFSSTLLDLKTTSPVFFLQGTENSQYQIYFGDNTVGRKPADGAVVVAEYRIPNGELPNGINVFSPDGPIDGQQNITVTVNQAAIGGAINETTESIQYYAPLSFATQDRAVTVTDYESLLKINFPEIKAISVYGGDQLTPPQYGKVFISLAIENVDGLPDSKLQAYTDFIKPRTGVTITPVFVLPEYLYIRVTSTVKYNINKTSLSPNDITALVISKIQEFNFNNLDDFKSTLYYSNLVEAIDATDQSIVSNQTVADAFKKILPKIGVGQNITVNFNLELDNTIPPIPVTHQQGQQHAVTSSQFVFDNKTVEIEDDSQGNLRLVTVVGTEHRTLYNIGTVNYDTGVIQLNNLVVSSYFGDSIRIYVKPRNKDFASVTNTILSISTDEIYITSDTVRI